jgi:hypothetical protein
MCHVGNLSDEQYMVLRTLPQRERQRFVEGLERERAPSTRQHVRPAFEAFLKRLDAEPTPASATPNRAP